LGQTAEAETSFRRAIALSQPLVDRFRGRFDHRQDLLKARIGLEELAENSGRPDEAIRQLEQALPLAEALARDDPQVTDHWRDVGLARQRFANLLFQSGRQAEAEQEFRGSELVLRKLADEHPEEEGYHFHLGETLKMLGYLVRLRGDPAGARRLW